MTQPRNDKPHNGGGPVPKGATTLLETLNDAREAGYAGQFIAQEDGGIRCSACQRPIPSVDADLDGFVRLEGASDAADLNLVCWLTCPSCGTGGVLTLGYGPNATAADVAVMASIDLDEASQPGAAPDA